MHHTAAVQVFVLPPERPEALAEPRPQEWVQRPTVEQLADVAPMVQFLDALVPRIGDQLMDAFRLLVGGAHHNDHGLEDEEDEDKELVEEFNQSVGRSEHSRWRPMRLSAPPTSVVGAPGGGRECTFAHGEPEVHPRALS